jgi:hypothetical protein
MAASMDKFLDSIVKKEGEYYQKHMAKERLCLKIISILTKKLI